MHRSKQILIILGVLLLWSSFLFAPNTFTKKVNAAMPAPVVYTILYLDSHGKVATTWKGDKTDYEEIQRVEDGKRIPNLLTLQSHNKSNVHSNTSARPFINGVSPCTFPNDFFDLYSDHLECFANAGSYTISDGNYWIVTYKVSSGKNHGYIGDWLDGNIYVNWNTTVYPPDGGSWWVNYIDILPA